MRRAPAVVLAAAVAGCATPGKEVVQEVRVETPGCTQVACELSNDRGRWTLASTPGSVSVATSHTPLTVSCRAAGEAGASRVAGSATAPTTGAGAVAGGVIGGAAVGAAVGGAALAYIPVLGVITVVAGAAAGALTGQAVESGQAALRYPDVISVPMSCPPPAAAAAPSARSPLGLRVRGLAAAEAQAAGLGARTGVLVTAVREGSAAAAADLREGDVVLEADGRPLDDAAMLEEHLRALPGAAAVELRVWRQGAERVVRLVPAAAVR